MHVIMTTIVSNELSVLELLLESAKAITSEVEMEKLVQQITDIGTKLSGAKFGAFFYNKTDKSGESLLLYTISGVAREAFSKFPMPRNTKIFSPTFSGKGIIRYDDVTKVKEYGHNPPHSGMPKGHLPVKSYLAAPVISPITGEVIGGLFFGHPEPGVFTGMSERLIEGIASQAAIAMGNARLFEEKKLSELKLMEQKEQYYSIFNSSSDAMLIFDKKGYVVEVNPAAVHLHGSNYENMIGKHGSMLMQQNPQQFEAIRDIVISGRKYKGVGFHTKSDASSIETEITAVNFIYKAEPHLLYVVRDISSGKQAEAALKKSEEFTHVITNASPVALWMSNSRAEIIYVNKTWVDWTGKAFDEHMGYGWADAIITEDRERALNNFVKSVAHQKLFETDFRIRRQNGEIRWCVANGSPYYNLEGQFEGYAGSCMDITERKEAEQKLESQNVLINTITNNTLQALFMMDDRQVCTYMNPAAEQMIGFKVHEVQDKPLHYYVHHTYPDGRHFPLEECAIDRALPTKSQTQGEEVFIRKDGSFFPVAFTASPIVENGVPIGTVIEVRDTSEEKRIQEELRDKEVKAKEMLELKVKERTAELEKSNYELLQFASVASHDLKEPLRKISIFSKMLKDKSGNQMDASMQRYLNNIISSAGRMTTLIDDLLAFSRLSQSNISFQPTNLNTLLQQILTDLEIAISEKKAEINISDLCTIDGIPLQLGQVFQNLISNSLKFTHPDRTPEIWISSQIINQRGKEKCRIVYRDNGIGFKNTYAEKIFEIFQRLHTKEKYEGTGVGLAIVKKLISLHNGTIIASGEENEGAEFEIILPLKQDI